MTSPGSCLYEIAVSHARIRPHPHAFRHRLFTFCLDLDELPALAGRLRLFGYNRPALYSFHDADYLPLGAPTLRENLMRLGAREGLDLSGARVRIVGHLRTAGHFYNPVTFYFCSEPDGRPICAIAEVTNTFQERKAYVLRPEPGGTAAGAGRVSKLFYVSPFIALDSQFHFVLPAPGSTLRLRADAHDADGPILFAAMAGVRRPLTDARLATLTLRYPLVTLSVLALIHAHALRLLLKRIPWFRKGAHPELQVGLIPSTHRTASQPESAPSHASEVHP